MDQFWFVLALIPPLLYAATNHIDKELLVKYFKKGGVGTLILVSSLLSIIPIPFILWFEPAVLVSLDNMPILAAAGLLNVGLVWFYLHALSEDEPSVVIVFYQLVPVLGLVFGYFILDEVINEQQSIAMVIILLGTALVSFEMDDAHKFRLRGKTVGYMLLACTCWALETVLLKKVALEENMWRSLFWEQVMMVIVGICIFAFVPTYRRHFLAALKGNSKKILLLNATNETIFIVGNIVGAFASMLAPVALVLLAQPFQSIFVLIIGIALMRFLPGVSAESMHVRHLWQKAFAIGITGAGTYVLLTA